MSTMYVDFASYVQPTQVLKLCEAYTMTMQVVGTEVLSCFNIHV